MPVTGGKIDITNRIAHYLDTGEIMATPPMQAKKSTENGIINENDFIEPNFACSELHRNIMKSSQRKNMEKQRLINSSSIIPISEISLQTIKEKL